jgi:MarR family transcriptional regulator, 2-MHQ and catechol-resistance regulon repressor
VTAKLDRGVPDQSQEQLRAAEHPPLRAWTALARCYSTIVRAASRDVSRHDLSLPQFAVLEVLYHKGPLPLGQIGALLLVTGGNVTYVVDELEARGLVRRDRSPHDRRVVNASLTARGTELMDTVFPEHAAFVTELFGALDDAELAELRRLVKKLGLSVAAKAK